MAGATAPQEAIIVDIKDMIANLSLFIYSPVVKVLVTIVQGHFKMAG